MYVFSGKSTEIIKLMVRLEKIDETYMTIKPKVDNRYSTTIFILMIVINVNVM